MSQNNQITRSAIFTIMSVNGPILQLLIINVVLIDMDELFIFHCSEMRLSVLCVFSHD